MGKTYGIDICREALIKLSSDKRIEDRFRDAILELKVLDKEDLSKPHFEMIENLHQKFYSISELGIDNMGNLISDIKTKEILHLKDELINLCVEIIDQNSRPMD